MKKTLLCILILCFISLPLFAQDPNWAYVRTDNTGIGGQSHFTIQGDAFDNIWTGGYTSSSDHGSLVRIATNDTVYTNWGTYSENYLPNGLIFDIVFDSTGIIWVATESGLTTSEDGLVWEHFDTTNTTLLSDQIESIAIDSNDDPWVVATNSDLSLAGIGYFDGTAWQYYTSANSELPAATQFRDIAVDVNNVKWIASDNGLISYDGAAFTVYNTSNSELSSNDIAKVAIDDQDRVWALVGNAIDIFDGSNWTQINSNEWPVTNFNGRSMHLKGDAVMIAESSNGRILMYDGTTWQLETVNFSIYDCYIDNSGNYWVSGYGVVGKFDGTDWTRYTRYNTGLPDNFNNDIFIDSQGRKWFANGSGGIQVFDCPNWEVYGPNNEGLFPNPQPLYQTTIGSSISEDTDGDIWFTFDGTSGYAIQIPNGDYQDYASWVIWDNTNSHPGLQFPEEVEATENGEVFIRAYNGNTFMYDKNNDSWTLWNLSNGLTSPPYCLTAHPNGSMYIGGYQNIDIYDNGTWNNMDLSGQGIEHIRDIQFDSNEHMWLATTDGLWNYDGTTWTNWNESNSNIAADNVTAIDIDYSSNTIYLSAHNTQIAPYYGGISYFDGTGNTFTTFLDGSSPLAHKQVEDIALDSFGNIWALTQSEGFSLYNPNGIAGFECIDRSLQRILTVDEFETTSNFQIISHPNPFDHKTSISFEIANAAPVSLEVYDLLGRLITSSTITDVVPGKNTTTVDLTGQESGIYFGKITVNDITVTVKLLKK